MILTCLSGAQMGSNNEKKIPKKSRDTATLKSVIFRPRKNIGSVISVL